MSMRKINKFIVIALATLLLQSCSTELQNLARSSGDVYQKQEYLKWDQLVEDKKAEIAAKRGAMTRSLARKDSIYRTLRAYYILSEDDSMLNIDEEYVDRSALRSCGVRHRNMSRDMVLAILFKRKDEVKVLDTYRMPNFHRAMNSKELVGFIEASVNNYIQCTEETAPSITINMKSAWKSTDKIYNAKTGLMMDVITKRLYLAITY